jgi:hypothetical protein
MILLMSKAKPEAFRSGDNCRTPQLSFGFPASSKTMRRRLLPIDPHERAVY